MGWLHRRYSHDRVRYYAILVGLVWSQSYFVGLPLGIVVSTHLFDMSASQVLTVVGVLAPIGIVVIGGILWWFRADHLLVVRWLRGDGTASPSDVARTLQTLPQRAMKIAALPAALVVVPAVVGGFAIALDGMTAGEAAGLVAGTAICVIYAQLISWWLFVLGLRPLLADLAVEAPAANRRQAVSGRLARDLFVGMFGSSVLAGFVTGSLREDRGAGADGIAATLGTALIVSSTCVAVLIALVALNILEPLRELIRGARAVGEGELDTQVPVTSDDELGELSETFNDMVDGLHEREALRGENVELSARVVATADAERRRMERDLHDGAQQRLVILQLELSQLARGLEAGDPTAAKIERLRDDVAAALDELRDLAHGIYPAVLETDGLPGALEEAAQRAAIPTLLECAAGRYPRELEAAVYFCCLEALQNASKYAGDGARAMVSLAQRNGSLHFTVSDDGAGFDPATSGGSHGLQNMTDRIRALGGTLEVVSAPGSGTSVRGTLPREQVWTS